jgi:hypothetical protein
MGRQIAANCDSKSAQLGGKLLDRRRPSVQVPEGPSLGSKQHPALVGPALKAQAYRLRSQGLSPSERFSGD